MRRALCAALILVPAVLAAQPSLPSRLEMAMQEMQRMATAHAAITTANAEILGLLHEASRALDDWQTNKAVAVAADRIGQAKRIALRFRTETRRAQSAVQRAEDILRPAQQSAMAADLMKLRAELQDGPIAAMRGVVADDMHALATLTNKTAEMTGILAKALEKAGAAAVDRHD